MLSLNRNTFDHHDKLLEQGDANQDGQFTRNESPGGPAKQHFVYIDADKNGRVTREEYAAIEVLARNSLDEPILATPAIVDGDLYVRTKSQIYAFGSDGKPLVSADNNSKTKSLRRSP